MWQLAGGDLESVLGRAGKLRSKAPILRLCDAVLDSGEPVGVRRDQALLYDASVTSLSLEELHEVRASYVTRLFLCCVMTSFCFSAWRVWMRQRSTRSSKMSSA